MATMVGATAFALAVILFEGDTRQHLRSLIIPIVSSYAIALTLISPYLYFFLSKAAPRAPMWQPFLFSADIGPDEIAVLADALVSGIEKVPAPASAAVAR